MNSFVAFYFLYFLYFLVNDSTFTSEDFIKHLANAKLE